MLNPPKHADAIAINRLLTHTISIKHAVALWQNLFLRRQMLPQRTPPVKALALVPFDLVAEDI